MTEQRSLVSFGVEGQSNLNDHRLDEYSPCSGCPHWGGCRFNGAECKREEEFE